MKLKHRVRINVADHDGNEQEVLQSTHTKLPKRLLTVLFGDFCEVLILNPSKSVEGIEIREMRGEVDE